MLDELGNLSWKSLNKNLIDWLVDFRSIGTKFLNKPNKIASPWINQPLSQSINQSTKQLLNSTLDWPKQSNNNKTFTLKLKILLKGNVKSNSLPQNGEFFSQSFFFYPLTDGLLIGVERRAPRRVVKMGFLMININLGRFCWLFWMWVSVDAEKFQFAFKFYRFF